MNIRKATSADFEEIVHIYAGARELMRHTGNGTQWKHTYPTDDIILADIANGNLHILFDEDGIQGVFALFPEGDSIYDHIDGAWLNDAPHAAVHRVASAGKKKGILSECMRYCFSLFTNIKIDTHENNKIMQHQLEKEGFIRCGIITLANGEERIAYQCYQK
ncbi:MAG: N-acetyltransferase [Clostridia bacterium]|nr:N-acetyltransferase [Clostridia bacterium]